ncbi:MAG TPA: AraC family transcriptional regulator [Ideonella sp.]|nr:AraC family transcriptional regulator [Ideonella sp.]
MRKNQALFRAPTPPVSPHADEQGTRLRRHLRDFAERSGKGRLALRLADRPGGEVARGEGHFHLVPELFLQVAGWTLFRFPQGELHLGPGEALLLPPRLLHAERVGQADSGEPFCNLVVYAEAGTLSCHLAHETAPGRPGILYLETSRHAQAARIHDWLAEAAQLGEPGDGHAAASRWAAAQLRSLVAAATIGALRALDDPQDPAQPREPAPIARVRVLVQNQLGDPALSVRHLAAHVGCTPDYLSHLFARTTGEHLAAFIVRQRMERAAHLLGKSEMAGKEIAWACGFATASYFTRSFRTHFGLTPKAWRAAAGGSPPA